MNDRPEEGGMTARAWWDRQLIVKSWDRRGLSPVNIGIICLIALSAFLFAIETEPMLAADWGDVLFATNVVILGLFAGEFFLRLWSAGASKGITGFGKRMGYAEPVWFVIDFLAFAPELLLLIAFLVIGNPPADWLAGFRLIRLLRFAKLMRYLPGVRMLVETIASVWSELLASVVLAAVLIFLAAVLIHLAEGHADPENFGSVPRALWWSVVTLTTVGYGDVLPHTLPGRIAAGAVAIVGVGIVALPSGIVAGAFIERLRTERMKKRRADEETSE